MTACNFTAPNGAKSLLYEALELNYGPDKATQIWNYTRSKEFKDAWDVEDKYDNEAFTKEYIDANGEPTIKWIAENIKLPESQVVMQMKALAILRSEVGLKTFEKGVKNHWDLNKILTELRIPKLQKELIFSLGVQDYDDIIANLLAHYSFAVQIETATKLRQVKADKDDNTVIRRGGQAYRDLGDTTDHYKGMTAPGGTNYKEKRIITPQIVPAIKGHAAFAEPNDIGWARMDELSKYPADLNQSYQDYQRGAITEEAWTTIKEISSESLPVLRILEIQSDLFQNGRDREDLESAPNFQERIDNGEKWNDIADELNSRKGNQFLQLLNKENNWVTFFVKALIQDAAKNSYEKVWFPAGNTAAKIEGHDTLEKFIADRERWIAADKKEIERVTNEPDEKIQSILESDNELNDLLGRDTEVRLKEVTKEDIEHFRNSRIETSQNRIDQFELELEQARTGTLKISSIAQFYEKTIYNILEKQGYQPTRVKDAHGNEWYQIDITPKALKMILYSKEAKLDPTAFTIHSGGAIGSDTEWGTIGAEFGVVNVNHYWHGTKTPTGNKQITQEEFEEGWQKVLLANKTLKRKPENYKSLLSRNWLQVKNADAIFAIGNVVKEGTEVAGGTGWAVQMAIDANKPVFVFDQNLNTWMKYNYTSKSFNTTGVPTLTPNFAGIGTRKITEAGKQAIRDVYTKTFSGEATKPVTQQATKLTSESFGKHDRSSRITYDEASQIVKDFYQAARENPGKIFDATAFTLTDLRKATESGYTPAEFAVLFTTAPIPHNVKFNEQFEQYMSNILEVMNMSASEVSQMMYPQEALTQILQEIRVPVRDENGVPTGTMFTAEQERAAIDTIVSRIRIYFTRDEAIKVKQMLSKGGAVYNDFVGFRDKFKFKYQLPNWITPAHAEALSANYQAVLNSWNDFATKALFRLEALGLRVKDRSLIHNISSLLENEEVVETDEGRGLRDWSESSFEIDPKDTAGTRIKLFLASIREVTIGEEREPAPLDLKFSNKALRDRINGRDPILGRKTTTIRSGDYPLGAQYLITVDGIKHRAIVESKVTEEDLKDDAIWALANEEGIVPVAGDVIMRLEEWRPRKDVLVPKENYLGFAELVDFDDLFQKLLETLYDVPNNFEAILEALEAEGNSFKPIFLEVANRLRRESDQIQKEFVKVMSKQYQEFNILLFSRRRDGFLDMTPINANQGSAVQTILKGWRENQKNAEIITRDQVGNLIVNPTVAQRLVERLEEIQTIYESDEYPSVETVLRPFAKDILEANGILLPEAAFDKLFANAAAITKNTSVSGGIHDQFRVTEDGTPRGIFSAIVMKLGGLTEEDTERTEKSALLLNNNPLYTENTAMRILAKLAYRFSDKAAAGSHYNSENKSIYAFGMHTHLSKSTRDLVQSETYRQNLRQTHLGKNSWLLKLLSNSTEARENFGIQYVDGLKDSYKKDATGITRPSMSPREQLIFSMGQFQHQKSKYGNFLSLTHSDKATTPMFVGVPKFQTGNGMEMSAAVQQAVWDTFFGEFSRVRSWYTDVVENNNPTKNAAYNKGGGLYYFIPQFNYDNLVSLATTGIITQEELQMFWLDKGVPNTRPNIVKMKPLVTRLFDQLWLQIEIDNLVDRMKKEGFNEGLVDYSYFMKNLNKVGITAIKGKYYFEKAEITKEQALEAFLPWAAKDYLTNSFLVNTAVSSLVYGDPAMNYKGKEGTSELMQVAATMQEYQKRLAKDIAPGIDPTWDTEHYQTITLLDSERLHPELDTLAKYRGEEINGTDAQELTTVEEHLYVMWSQGLINGTVYHEMLGLIKDGQNNPDMYYEFTKPEHTSVIMQIMKPVSVSQDFSEVPGSAVIHYIKSSAMPLYPPMTAGMEIDKLRQLMETQGIPRANFASAKKTGNPAAPLQVFDKNGNVVITKDTDITGAIQTVSRAGLRIQQEVPYDEFKDEILTGSQMNKLFVDDIEEKTFSVNGKEMTGVELKARKEEIRKELIRMQINEFSHKIGAELIDGQLRILDQTKLLSLLEDEAISRNYSPNDLLAIRRRVTVTHMDGTTSTQLAIPLFFNSAADRFESLLMSVVKKVGQIYMPGRSFIQASSAGFKFKEKKTFESLSKEQRNKIVWVPGYDGSSLKTLSKDSPAEVLIPFSFLVNDANGNPTNVNIKDYLTPEGLLDTNKIPESLLQTIGFRIPTQKQNSMLPMKVVGFLPTNMGDVIVVPEAITKQMGSDFDVDKLYTYRRSYIYNNGKFEVAAKNFIERLGADNEEYQELETSARKMAETANEQKNDKGRYPRDVFNKYLGQAVEQKYPAGNVPKHRVEISGNVKESLINEYFDLAWSVLSDSEMYEIVMQPLDTPDLKLEAQRALENAVFTNFYSPLTQLEDYQSQKDAKIMVGITSQFVTFSSWVQDKSLSTKEGFEIKIQEEGEINDKHIVTTLSGKANATYIDETTGEAHKRTRMDDNVTIQSEVLDHAKNRTVDKLNINLKTIFAAEALINLGSTDGRKASHKHLALFLRQPAIIRLVDELKRGGDALSTTFEADLFSRTVNRLIQEYVALADIGDRILGKKLDVFITENDFDLISVDKLKANLKTQDGPTFFMRQAGMLLAFQRLDMIGREMAKIQKTFNQDPRGPGKNMIEAFEAINNRQRVINSEVIAGVENLLNSEQGFVHETVLDIVENTIQDILPYALVRGLTAELTQATGRKQLSLEVQRDIAKSFKAYIFAHPDLGISNDANYDRFRLLYGDKKIGEVSLAQRVWNAQQNTQNYFLRRLQPQIATIPNTPSYVFYLASKTSALDDQENMAAFIDLLADPETKDLAEDLVRYTYVTGGKGGSFNFMRYIPTDFLTTIPFAATLREINKFLSYEDHSVEFTAFAEQWVRHNPQLMLKVEPDMLIDGDVPGERFKIKIASKGSPTEKIVTKPNGTVNVYPKYLSYYNKDGNLWQLYKQTDNSTTEYQRIDILGNNYIDEYTYSSEYEPSIFVDNKALIKPHRTVVELDQTVDEKELAYALVPAFKDLNIEMGNYKKDEAVDFLSYLGESDAVNPAMQVLATYLSETVAAIPQNFEFDFKLHTNEIHDGEFDTTTRVADILGRANSTTGSVVRTIIHETLHGITSLFTFNPVEVQKKYPAAYKALKEVQEVQQEALQAVMTYALSKGISSVRLMEVIETGKANNELERDIAKMLYLTSNYDEFLSGIFENENLQKLLNDSQSKYAEKTTLMARLVDMLYRFLKALGDVLGIDIKDKSILKVGLERSFNLVEKVKNIKDLEPVEDLGKAIANTYFKGVMNAGPYWQVDTEKEAKAIVKDIIKNFPMMHAQYKVGISGVTVIVQMRKLYSLDLSPKTKLATNPIDRVYGKVQDQIQAIRASIAQNKKSPDVLRQNQLLAELRLLANDLKATQDLDRIKDVMKFQIAWARKVSENFLTHNKPVSINRIMTAFRLVATWSDIADTGLEEDTEYIQLRAEAENLYNEFASKIMSRVFQEESTSGITNTDLANIEDMPVIEARFLDLARAKDKVTQEVALTVQNTHRKYLEEGQDLLKELAEFEREMKEVADKRGLKPQELYEKFMQDGADWGLVNRYTSEFYKWKAGLKNRLTTEIDDAEAKITDEKLRSDAITKAYSRYWRNLGKKAGFVNVNILFDEEGNEVDTPAAKKYIQEMIDEYGEQFTNEVLEEAKRKYIQYIHDREDIFDMYDTELEEGLMEEDEVNEAKASWDLENSPLKKLSTRALVTSSKYLNLGEKYLTLVPHDDAKADNGVSFFSDKFEDIQNDEELKKIYERLYGFMQSFTSNLPYYIDAKLGENFLPAIKKGLITSIADVPGYLRRAPAKLINDITASSYEEYAQNHKSQQIPVMFTDNPFTGIVKPTKGAPPEAWDAYNKQREEQAKTYTRNLPRILEVFGLMSLHHKNFSEARDAIELGEEILKKADKDLARGVRQVDADGKIKTVKASLKNTLGALDYTKEVLMFKRTQNLQGRLSETARPKKGENPEKRLRELKAEQQDLEDKLENNEISFADYNEGIQRIGAELEKFEIRRLYASKIADRLMTWTRLKAISYNPLSAVNNLTFGLISAITHANGRQDFGFKDFRKGLSVMLNSTGRSLGLARITGNDGAMHKTAEKVLNVMDRMNIMGDLNDTGFEMNTLEQKKRGLRAAIQPYQMLRSGDYFMKGLVMIAMLNNHKVTVNGEETNLWKMMSQDGKLPEDLNVDWAKLRNKIIVVNKIIMGNQDKSSPIWGKKEVLIRLAGQFRLSWISEGIAARFEGERDDIQLGRTRKGRYRTYLDLGFRQSAWILSKQLLGALPGVKNDPFANARLKNGKHFTDTDKANMRRNLAELGWLLMFKAVTMTINALANGDDDENRKKWLRFMANMATRSYQDVALYSSPSVFDAIIGTPAPALTTIRDVTKLFDATVRLATDDEYTAGQWFRKLTRSGIIIPQTTLFNRFETMTTKDLSTIAR